MPHTFSIYIAWSNLVSPSNSDTHHMGQVQVRMKIHALSGFVSSIIHLPLLLSHSSFFLRGMNAIHVFLSFSGECCFCNHYLKDFGVMDVYVNDPRRWINLNFFGGTKFEQAHNVKDSYRFEFVYMALEWVLAKLSIRACRFSCFRNESFQEFESRASITSCHYIIESNKQTIKRS